MRTKHGIWAVSAGLLAAATMASLAGCSGPAASPTTTPPTTAPSTTASSAPSTTPAKAPVTLEFWDMSWGPSGKYDVKAKELVAKWNAAHPDIQVNYTLNTWDNWYQTFAQAVAAGTAPDVSTGGGFQPFGLEQDAGAILPLNDLVTKWQGDGTAADFKDGMLDYYKDSKGDYLAIPWGMDIRVWFYREDLLQQAGVKVPTTYDELKKACDAVHALGSDIYGIADGGTPHWTFMQGIANGAGMFDAQGNAQISTNPKEVAALEYIASMGQGGSGCINPSATTVTQDDAIAMFDQGKAAFVMDSPGFGPHVSADTLKVAKVLPPLANADGQKLGLYFVNGIMAYKQTKHPQEAMQFIEYWSSIGGDLISAGASAVSPRKSIDSNPAFDSQPLYRESVAAWGPPVSLPLYAQAPNGFGAMNTIDGDSTMLDLERALFAGTPDVKTAAAAAQAKIQGFVDAGR